MTVAVVLPGGGARGAYEIGALSVLLPALAARGERVSIWCGASVGAINAAALASLAHRPVPEQVSEAQALWRELHKGDVIAPLVGVGGARMILRALGHAAGLPGFGLASLLDPTPLAGSLDRWIDWPALDRNVARQDVQAVCAVATALPAGQTVGFVAGRGELPRRLDGSIRYVRTRLRGEHVRASAAIPVLFPTVEVTTPRSAAGHYTDGGTRLNSPIKPALDLGATKLIVIGLEPFHRGPALSAQPGRTPGIADVAANVLDGLLVDQVGQDLRRLAAINSFFAEDARTGTIGGSSRYRTARGHEPYRPIAYALVAPRRRGEIAAVAERVFAERYGGLRGVRDIDFALLARLMGSGRSRGEFLSFLLFERHFVRALLDLGGRDATRWLRRHPAFWCRDADHDLAIGGLNRERLADEVALDEYRALRGLRG